VAGAQSAYGGASDILLFSLAVFVPLALALRLLAGHWLHPGAMFAGYWAVAAAAPIAFYGRALDVSHRALLHIAVAVAVFGLGSLIFTERNPSIDNSHLAARLAAGEEPDVQSRLLMWTVAVGTVSGFGAGLAALAANGIPLDSVMSIDGLMSAGYEVSQSRYTNLLSKDYSSPTAHMVMRVLLALTYCAALVAPFLALTKVRLKKLWMFAPLPSLVFYGVLTTERAGMVFGIALSLGGYIAMRTLRDGRLPRIGVRGVAIVAMIVLLVTPLFVGMAMLRLGKLNPAGLATVRNQMNLYVFGYLPAFSGWLEQQQAPLGGDRPLGLGSATIAGMSLLTGQDREAFRYEEWVVIDDEGRVTNIYTIFRGLLIDFGQVGGVLALFVLGALAGRTYSTVIRRGSVIATMGLAACYSVILMSNTISLIHYSNVLGAMILATVVVGVALASRSAVKLARPAHQLATAASRPPGVTLRTSTDTQARAT